jgi:hypothetical protein
MLNHAVLVKRQHFYMFYRKPAAFESGKWVYVCRHKVTNEYWPDSPCFSKGYGIRSACRDKEKI